MKITFVIEDIEPNQDNPNNIDVKIYSETPADGIPKPTQAAALAAFMERAMESYFDRHAKNAENHAQDSSCLH